ncbi:MAG TPA: hypothetical protein GXZ51_04435 [Acholeplasma sp.]|jgi:hypothetical protein|nr:hypothetical protein [Acholeplasma sp.]
MEKHKLLILIVDSKQEKQASKLIHKISPSMQFVHIGKGTAELAVLDELGVGRAPKAVIWTVIPESLVTKVLDRLNQRLYLDEPNSGIVFTIDLTAVSGLGALQYLTGKEVKNEKS